MKDVNYFVLKSGMIIRKDILCVTIGYDAVTSVTGSLVYYIVMFAETSNTVVITEDDYLELKEILC